MISLQTEPSLKLPDSFYLMSALGVFLSVLIHIPIRPLELEQMWLGLFVKMGQAGADMIVTSFGFAWVYLIRKMEWGWKSMMKQALWFYLFFLGAWVPVFSYQMIKGVEVDVIHALCLFSFTHNFYPEIWKVYKYFEHVWVLGIALQWQVLLWTFKKYFSSQVKWHVLVLLVLALSFMSLRFMLAYATEWEMSNFFRHNLPFRLDTLVWGALAAIALTSTKVEVFRPWAMPVALLSVLGLVVLNLLEYSPDQQMMLVSFNPMGVALLLLALGSVEWRGLSGLAKCLKPHWVLGLFVFHYPLRYFLCTPLSQKMKLSYSLELLLYFGLSLIIGVIMGEVMRFIYMRVIDRQEA